MRRKSEDASFDCNNLNARSRDLKRDYLKALAAVEQAQNMHEFACQMQHHGRLAKYESRLLRVAADAQLEILTRPNGYGVRDGAPSAFGGHRRDGPAELTGVLERAIAATSADMGNIQLFDSSSTALRIQVQLGFDKRFLDFFDNVHEGQAACGTAMGTGLPVVVEDVTQSPIFLGTDSLEVMLDARARAVQSTPLISKSGLLLGVLSTHYHRPRRPSDRDLRLLTLLARRAGTVIEG